MVVCNFQVTLNRQTIVERVYHVIVGLQLQPEDHRQELFVVDGDDTVLVSIELPESVCQVLKQIQR